MVESSRLIRTIKNYKDLRDSKSGEFILINGRSEMRIDSDSEHIKKFNYNINKIYTLSLEGNYIVQNHYESIINRDDFLLEPFMKISCQINSGCALENWLYDIAKKGGLL